MTVYESHDSSVMQEHERIFLSQPITTVEIWNIIYKEIRIKAQLDTVRWKLKHLTISV